MDVSRMQESESISVSLSLAVPLPAAYGAASADAQVTLSGSIEKNKKEYRFIGEAKASFSMQCARCLRAVPVSLAFGLDERFAEEPGGDEDFWPLMSRNVDFMPVVLDNLLPSLPAKTLCAEECKGLCRQCGADLNDNVCGCNNDLGDERFAVLKQWFSDEDTDTI